MNTSKESAVFDFLAMISKSWTFARMTEAEKSRCKDLFFSAPSENALKGDYKTRWKVCQAIYNSYLYGLGYDGFLWRETDEQNPKF